jgi:hypothetical protein
MKRNIDLVELVLARKREKCTIYTTKFRKQVILLGIFVKNIDIVINYLGELHDHIRRQVMILISKRIDEARVQRLYFEKNMKKGKLRHSK